MSSFTTTISGWNPWRRLATRIGDVAKTDAPFPDLYTPTSAVWIQSLASHCDIYWSLPVDTLTAFSLGGGTTFTIDRKSVV